MYSLHCYYTCTVLLVFPIFRDELNRKLDHKRQEISESQQALRQLENSVHSLREEKVVM